MYSAPAITELFAEDYAVEDFKRFVRIDMSVSVSKPEISTVTGEPTGDRTVLEC